MLLNLPTLLSYHLGVKSQVISDDIRKCHSLSGLPEGGLVTTHYGSLVRRRNQFHNIPAVGPQAGYLPSWSLFAPLPAHTPTLMCKVTHL